MRPALEMNAENLPRPEWFIDRLLAGLIGDDIRVAAESFSPAHWNGELPNRFVSPRELILPDNSDAGGLPLYFEGRLQRFVRQIGVVYVGLDSPTRGGTTSEGTVSFRGGIAVILRGPAVVRLSHPFRVERLPAQVDNYWADMRMPRAQFQLPL